MDTVKALNYITRQIETIVSVAVNALKSNTYKVKVEFPKSQKINGNVNVSNLAGEISRLIKQFDGLKKAVENIEIPDKVTVSNIKDTPLQKETKIPPFPTKLDVTIKNPQEKVEITNFKQLLDYIENLNKSIKDINVSPVVNVKTPNVEVISPQPTVIRDEEKLLGEDPTHYVPVRLTDGKEFYKALDELITTVTRSAKNKAQLDENNHTYIHSDDPMTPYKISDIDDATYPKYFGSVSNSGKWVIMRQDLDGSIQNFRFATGVSGYDFEDRDSLDYSMFSEIEI